MFLIAMVLGYVCLLLRCLLFVFGLNCFVGRCCCLFGLVVWTVGLFCLVADLGFGLLLLI